MRCVYLIGKQESKTVEEGESMSDARHPFTEICFGIVNNPQKVTVDELSKYCDCKEIENAYEGCSVYVERHNLDMKNAI